MSEKQVQALMKKGKKLFLKTKFQEALEIFENVLKISPEFIAAMNFKARILRKLKRYEEHFQTSFNLNLLKLKKDGEIPLDINSSDSWIEEAIKLINNGQNERALMCIAQATYLSPIVNRDGLSSISHHTNAKIYYFTAIILFNKRENYDFAMSLFEKANKLDPNLTIPDKIKSIYNNYLSNRSGVGVKMIAPLNASNLRALIPFRDKILVSTYASAVVRIHSGNKIKTYTWKTHMLLTDYGLLFRGSRPICKQSEYYVPWPFIFYTKISGQFTVTYHAGGLKYLIPLTPTSNPQAKSGEGPYEYIAELNLKPLIELRKEEMLERTVKNLKSLELLPSYKEYINHFEKLPKKMYDNVKKTIKRSKS